MPQFWSPIFFIPRIVLIIAYINCCIKETSNSPAAQNQCKRLAYKLPFSTPGDMSSEVSNITTVTCRIHERDTVNIPGVTRTNVQVSGCMEDGAQSPVSVPDKHRWILHSELGPYTVLFHSSTGSIRQLESSLCQAQSLDLSGCRGSLYCSSAHSGLITRSKRVCIG